jgi:hypothetical protein
MFNNYRVVTITPIGNYKYADLLSHYLLQNRDIIDQHIWWINTHNTYDISYISTIICKYRDFFDLYYNNNLKYFGVKNGLSNIYMQFNDKKTIYIKINDDICWMQKDALRELVQFRINNPEYFVIHPFINNTTKATYVLQLLNLFSMDILDISPVVMRKQQLSLSDLKPEISESIHKNFLELIKTDQLSELTNCLPKIVNFLYDYIPDHCVCWFGKHFTEFEETAKIYQKEWISQIESKERQMPTCICTSSIMSHFAFKSHENYLLNKTNILESYKNSL